MEYNFEVLNYEKEMKNYFKCEPGRHIKDTLFITLRNNGTRGWSRFKGTFKCVQDQSNYFFDDIQIPQEVYPNGSLELVLNFPRIEKNTNKGDVFCTIQLIYSDKVYNSEVIRFRKDFDLFGNAIVKEENIVIEEGNEKDLNKEKEKEQFQPIMIEEAIKNKNKENKVEEKKENENDIIVKKFRSAFDFSKADYSDEYLLDLILKSNNDFQIAMMLHLENEDAKKEEKINKSKTNEGLAQLVEQFRKEYQLSEEDYPTEKLKEILEEKEGNFENAFDELMRFIQ